MAQAHLISLLFVSVLGTYQSPSRLWMCCPCSTLTCILLVITAHPLPFRDGAGPSIQALSHWPVPVLSDLAFCSPAFALCSGHVLFADSKESRRSPTSGLCLLPSDVVRPITSFTWAQMSPSQWDLPQALTFNIVPPAPLISPQAVLTTFLTHRIASFLNLGYCLAPPPQL